MLTITTVIARIPALREELVIDWVSRGWVRVEGATPAEWVFTELDVSRLNLLVDLRIELAMDDETMPVVLSLLDQVYTLRRTLVGVIDAVDEAPDDVKRRVLDVLKS